MTTSESTKEGRTCKDILEWIDQKINKKTDKSGSTTIRDHSKDFCEKRGLKRYHDRIKQSKQNKTRPSKIMKENSINKLVENACGQTNVV